jgi:hypothetical protein
MKQSEMRFAKELCEHPLSLSETAFLDNETFFLPHKKGKTREKVILKRSVIPSSLHTILSCQSDKNNR